MSEILKNAITSIVMGVEDFETGSDERMLSAARNYYAGLLLLAKECLIRSAPEADPMDIIGAKFKPIPNGSGGVEHEVVGYATIDLSQLQARFKDFDLDWPNADIKKLQKFRNDLEHFHLNAPARALGEAIASSFPMIVDFFAILQEEPQAELADVWDTILEQKTVFEKIQVQCLDSLDAIEWPAEVSNLDRMSCPSCGSSLIGQSVKGNTDYESINWQCFQCGEEIPFAAMIESLVKASYAINDYILAKEGMNSQIADCPICSETTYVETGDVSICFTCLESVASECIRCSTKIDVHDYVYDNPTLCGYCAHMYEKIMRE